MTRIGIYRTVAAALTLCFASCGSQVRTQVAMTPEIQQEKQSMTPEAALSFLREYLKGKAVPNATKKESHYDIVGNEAVRMTHLVTDTTKEPKRIQVENRAWREGGSTYQFASYRYEYPKKEDHTTIQFSDFNFFLYWEVEGVRYLKACTDLNGGFCIPFPKDAKRESKLIAALLVLSPNLKTLR